MKVLVIATSRYTRGGITSVVKSHSESTVWSDMNCKWIETHIDRNLFYKILFLIKSILQFLFVVFRYDIIHIHLSEPISAKRKSIFYYISKFYQKKIILHFHSFSPETTINGTKKRLYKKMFIGADKVIVLSEQWKKWVLDEIPEAKVDILYNPCQSIQKTYSNTEKVEKSILFAGTLNQRKGFIDLIYAFSLVKDDFPEWKLTFAGNGDIDEGKKLCRDLHMEDVVVFKGWIAGMEKDKVFKEASIFCLPSYAEGFPMAVLDALSYGLPIITTPVGGIKDVFSDKINCLLFEAGDCEKLAENLAELMKSSLMRDNLGSKSIELAKEVFSISQISEDLRKIYTNL